MSAWTRINHAGSKIVALADTQLKWLNAAGLEFDLSAMGLGKRSKRFAAVIDDLKVRLHSCSMEVARSWLAKFTCACA